MKIKIAISPNFGAFNVPKGFETDSTGTKWRVELAEFLIKNATVSEQLGQYDKDNGGIQLIRKSDGQVLENVYYFDEATTKLLSGELGKLSVVEVNTDSGWVISVYDGAESIGDVPLYVRVDDYGRYEFCGNP